MKKLLTLLMVPTLGISTSLPDQIHLIRNPTHHVHLFPAYTPTAQAEQGRLIIIGDVHGMFNELQSLLRKTQYCRSNGDRIIFTGDLVNKGPDSAGVVQCAMDLNASSVRGNHEDKVLRVWAEAQEARLHAEAQGIDGRKALKKFEAGLSKKKRAALDVARSLSSEQQYWIASLPVAIDLGHLPGMGHCIVVHGGLVPGLALENQEPWAMYNIRALIDINHLGAKSEKDAYKATIAERLTDMRPGIEPTKTQLSNAKQELLASYKEAGFIPTGEFHDGTWWVETWNEREKAKPKESRLTVIYGHDSKRSVQQKDFSIGLDGRCVEGGMLTALVMQLKEGSDVRSSGLGRSLVSVSCQDE